MNIDNIYAPKANLSAVWDYFKALGYSVVTNPKWGEEFTVYWDGEKHTEEL